jgi:hypothetical protein
MNKEKSLFLKCMCSTHLLEVEYFNYNSPVKETGFNITIWNMNYNNTITSWKEKLKWCWNIIKTGNPWADSVVLTEERACELAAFILRKEQN